jgi:2-iminobutanoate/2-iminopropanoate deaminase
MPAKQKNLTCVTELPGLTPLANYSLLRTTTNPLVFLSGQIPLNSKGEIESQEPSKQMVQCMKNVKTILKEVNLDFTDIVKIVVYLENMDDFPKVNAEYNKLFTKNPPVRTCIAVRTLPKNGILFK